MGSTDLRARIRDALDADTLNTPNIWWKHKRTADAARELLPLVLTELDRLTAERDELRNVLRRIAEWDCLNPPDRTLCADHPWLKKLVDTALDASSGGSEAK